ncbi:MAG: hypothetical protein ACFCAD_09365 [Pleurocapsa sp.]
MTYENTKYGFDLNYPDDWNLKTIEDPFGTVARLFPNQKDAENIFVMIEVAKIDSNTSLEDYINLAISRILKYFTYLKLK